MIAVVPKASNEGGEGNKIQIQSIKWEEGKEIGDHQNHQVL